MFFRTRRKALARVVSGSLLVGVLVTAGCGPGLREVRGTIDSFLSAVQAGDSDALFCLMSGAAGSEDLGTDPAARRENFAEWVRARLDQYETERDIGTVTLDGYGIAAVKLFTLGKGTFFELGPVEQLGPETLRIRMEMRFGYPSLDLSRFSPGTTFYVCGVPPGRVTAIRIPRGTGEESAEVLERLSVEWTLERSTGSDGCQAGWAVASVRALEDTAATTRVTWAF